MQEGEEEAGKWAGTDGKVEGNRRGQGNETTVRIYWQAQSPPMAPVRPIPVPTSSRHLSQQCLKKPDQPWHSDNWTVEIHELQTCIDDNTILQYCLKPDLGFETTWLTNKLLSYLRNRGGPGSGVSGHGGQGIRNHQPWHVRSSQILWESSDVVDTHLSTVVVSSSSRGENVVLRSREFVLPTDKNFWPRR